MGWWFQSFSQKRHQNVCTALACRCIAIASPIEELCMIHIIFNSPNSRPLLQNSWSVSCIHTNHHPKQCCPCCQKWDLQLMHCWEVLYAESTLLWTLASWQLKPSNEETHSQVLVLLQRTQTWHTTWVSLPKWHVAEKQSRFLQIKHILTLYSQSWLFFSYMSIW